MARKRLLPYQEGTWFAVPLKDQAYAVGVVARMAGDGTVFGYFFGPRRDCVPRLDEVVMLEPSDALWLGMFGDLGLIKREWPIIGQSSVWRRESWPLPPFVRVDDMSDEAIMVLYSDDSLEPVRERKCDPALAREYPEDSLFGYGAVENLLQEVLRKPKRKKKRP